MKRSFTGLIILLLAASTLNAAAKWETMNFTDDLTKGFENLTKYCREHEIAVKDVLWANHTESADIKAGSSIYLPEKQADLLAIWQHIGAWQPKGLVPVTSGTAARRLVASQNKPETPIVQQPPVVSASVVKTPLVKTPAKPKQDSPAQVIAQTAKPDKILTAKRKTTQHEIPGLMDPIIILSPNGDPTTGPMKLIISGDKVEVVKLPQNAIPKNPNPADINAPFTSGYSYVSLYNAPGKPAVGNNVFMNFNTLGGKMMWPVDGKVSSPFGKWRGKHKHEGIDIPMPGGTPIRAARSGIVARTGNNSTIGFRGYGNFVMVDHGGSVRTFYAHCSRIAVVEGQRVMQGQIIGYVGSTGRSTANHLHFEVRINNAKVNPVPYLAGNSHLASNK